MANDMGRVEAISALTPPIIISWDPLMGELLRGHLETEGHAGVIHEINADAVSPDRPVILLPPPTYAGYLGEGWDARLRAVPLDLPMVVLARPGLPVRSSLQLNQRVSGMALLDSSRPTTVGTVTSALRMAIEGGQVIDPAFFDSGSEKVDAELTPAETRVYYLLAKGRSNSGIAEELFLSERTVEVHIRKIFSKLELTENSAVNRRVVAASLFEF